MLRFGLRLGFSILLTLVLVEAVSQVYYLRVAKSWADTMELDGFHFRRSENPVLVYELDADLEVDTGERVLLTNAVGIREAEDGLFEGRRKIALLGDSVVFGYHVTQDDCVSHYLQLEVDGDRRQTAVLNFGVSGYALREIAEYLKEKNRVYHVDVAVYLLNLNDFAWRDTVYEGADAALYRMYRRPIWASRWFARRAVYRWKKNGTLRRSFTQQPGWYRWLYEGNRERGFDVITGMAAYAAENGIDFRIVLLPAGTAFRDGTYQLADINEEIMTFCADRGIRCVDPTSAFLADHEALIDPTDHFSPAGSRKMAAIIANELRADE